ncbi:MAG: LptA/OstA family protein [Chthoniobacterales bacterium]
MMKFPLLPLTLLLLLVAGRAGAQTTTAPGGALGLGGLTDNRPAGSKTEITAQKEALFDEQKSTAIFLGAVRINDPAFLLSSDKLTVYLTKDKSGIDRVVAEGNVVIVQQTTDDKTKPATGRAATAEYVPTLGRVTLSGNPEMQQGINRHIATAPSTRMVLFRDGRATTEGPSRTVISDTSTPRLP